MAGVFIKPNSTGYADALVCEAKGLESLREVLRDQGISCLRVPEVYSVSESELKVTAVDSCSASPTTLKMFGEGLARMHKARQPQYGWGWNNYIGLSPQPNRWSANWGEFFVRDRLGYQVSIIREPSVKAAFEDCLSTYQESLVDWLNEHCTHASLLHGDLWCGNVLFDAEDPWLIDPAVYCGDREADLAMTEMFGGFGSAFYAAYDRLYPRSEVYVQKRDIYNLYHYLNHYNLFGSGYLDGCRRGFSLLKQAVTNS
ncbi:fructosamine kinase family protein [Marinobacter sp. 2_MG-2023]|uniref:fructosamine kinase family protein n=1 Tax=Marinobacter sp. 2_MG-2023 TaxID=3062679 RepID=UPI0026E3F996|nr:fructosamine kinase family protein [Marinobacter sp. 2_MG-2023]MDO6442208.1 fructosamine kinase family protein [Marinobacter sp. 2_MG-2023]